MIEQLMIGNYVSLEYNNCNKIYEILEIKHSSATISNIMNRDDFGENQYHNIYGIPLTEDILIRCGFENDIVFEGMVLDCENGCSIGISTSENVCYFRGNIETFWVDIVPEIAYLHQMQNLVKLLCNQTIELKCDNQ